ncbi:hypothetical protein KV203_02650 [Skermania piniformis]|uniref:Uncharacterized protein n=1 Tax=Skermania pinensis TaxID=39122 RepID=A0ABX8SCN9_9ACTN|nr:hypothetical protein KV203_02650 [Skermania piniformis]
MAQRRVEVQRTGGAVLQLAAVNGPAADVLTALLRVVAEEAARTPRFATAIAGIAAPAPAPAAPETGPATTAARTTTATRTTAAAKPRSTTRAKRQPGVLDPFVIYRESGVDALTAQLGPLTMDQLRDIIAEQEIDTRRETRYKRKQEVLVAWTVTRVRELADKGNAFR